MISEIAALAGSAFVRKNPRAVEVALAELGVQVSAAFFDFYSRYEGPFASDHSGFQLLDLCVGAPSIVSLTVACREQYAFLARYLVLTDLLGGGVLVYDAVSDAVYNVDFEGGERELVAGRLAPGWQSFREFLAYYVGQ
ncbi:MAG: hypothetical protein KBG48_34275 [Kofleriaceae bacterium]|nr:hypothetical protein [Kofleriaceae bacterium]MBP9172478.1 hypothetical protein [Kofleriaceae bacterium]MBP9862334.1 hypothetical protein [Kofleriaceae bacterium]